MSNVTGGNGVTSSQQPTGLKIIQVSDFYQSAGILHPITVGVIAILFVFLYLRLSSNRCVAPVSLFDWILSVALGSTVAGVVNGTSLVRGLMAICMLLLFQRVSSQLSSQYGTVLEHAINAPPLVIAFRGHALDKVMQHHRVSKSDLNGALRKAGIWNICQVEAVIIEPTGDFSIYKSSDRDENIAPEVLLDVEGYRRLAEHFADKRNSSGTAPGSSANKPTNGGTSDQENLASDIVMNDA